MSAAPLPRRLSSLDCDSFCTTPRHLIAKGVPLVYPRVGCTAWGRAMLAMYLTWLVRDRERLGFIPAQFAGHLGVSRQEYLKLEAGTRWPSSTGWERMVALNGWLV